MAGFNRLCSGSVLQLFCPEELEQLVCGSPVLDFEALERHTQYDDGYNKETQAICYFWYVGLTLGMGSGYVGMGSEYVGLGPGMWVWVRVCGSGFGYAGLTPGVLVWVGVRVWVCGSGSWSGSRYIGLSLCT
jgi:hypothetical protein